MVDATLLARYGAHESGDSGEWQRRARLLQSSWRERRGLAAGTHRGRTSGSRLTEEDGRPPRMAGYLTEAAGREAEAAVRSAPATGALVSEERLWTNLLSSQPLCFNLFGPLARDPDLATSALRLVWPRIRRVTDICFEWSPGRGDPHYTDNGSAFDVFVEYQGVASAGFLGIEVKYHENLRVKPASDKAHYADIATRHGAFREDAIPELRTPPLQQIWLDHLLALQLLVSDRHTYTEGMFVLLSPVGNRACTAAAQRYRECLTDTRSFDARRLEEVVQALRMTASEPWVDELYERYFGALPTD